MMGPALAGVFALAWIPFYIFRAEEWTKAFPSYHGAERFWVCATPALLATHMTLACVIPSWTAELPLWSVVPAVAISGGALVFWFWGRALIGPLRVRRLPDELPLQLRRDGAFGWVRHPLYCSYLVAAGAPLVVAHCGFLLVTYALCVVALHTRARQDERRLRAQLGAAYDAYCREVKRLVPFLW